MTITPEERAELRRLHEVYAGANILHNEHPLRRTFEKVFKEQFGKLLDALEAAERERDAAKQDAIELRDVLRRANFSPCDVPACNCGSWHERTTGNGFYARFQEIDEAIGSHDGMTTLQAVELLVAEREAISKAHREVIDERDAAIAELEACKAKLAALVSFNEELLGRERKEVYPECDLCRDSGHGHECPGPIPNPRWTALHDAIAAAKEPTP